MLYYVMSMQSSEYLLQLLQCFIKHQKQVQQIQSLLITEGHLLVSNTQTKTKKFNYKPTLFYNTLIRVHLNFGQNQNQSIIFYLFNHMLSRHNQNRSPPNSHTFPPLIKAATTLFSLSTGTSLHSQVVKRGLLYDPFIQTSLLAFYSQLGDLMNAHKMFYEIESPSVVESNAMLDAYARNGDMGSASLLFESMSERDVVSWTSFINGFLKNGFFDEAVRVFRLMIVSDDVKFGFVKPNEATFVSVLSCCANLDKGGAFCLGKQIHGYILRNEVALTVFIGTALLDFYGKVGCLDDAVKVFNLLTNKKVCTWNAFISALANGGRERQALDMFERMKEEGLSPNEVTLVAVLNACAHAKHVEVGLKLFQSMSSEFGVVPVMEHYGCVVDLLGRAGLLKEASEFLKRMPFEPDASVLGALLGACKIHGAIELANEVGRRLLRLQPHKYGQYVSLSNINAGVEKWVLAADVRKAMVNAGIRKIPAYSVIESM